MNSSGQQYISEDHNGSKDNDVKQLPSRIYQQLSLQLFSRKVCANFLIIFLKNGTDLSFQIQKESLNSELI